MAYGGQPVAGVGANVSVGPVAAKASGSLGGVSINPNLAPPVYKMVLVLVAIEAFMLMGGRLAFKHHHGG